MAEFTDIRKAAKDWLSKMFIPKDVSMEGLANTGIGQMANTANAVISPGMTAAAILASKFLRETNAGKNIQTMMDATGPGADDVLSLAAKGGESLSKVLSNLPEALAVVPPMIREYGRFKPRGVPASDKEIWHSNLAEELDKKFLQPGNPEDLISLREVDSYLNKLPSLGVTKQEMEHFNIQEYLNIISDVYNKKKMTRQDLADYIDLNIPNVDVRKYPGYYRNYTVAGEVPPYNATKGVPEQGFDAYTVEQKSLTEPPNRYPQYFRGGDIEEGFEDVPLLNTPSQPEHHFDRKVSGAIGQYLENEVPSDELGHCRITNNPDIYGSDAGMVVEEVQSDLQSNNRAEYPLGEWSRIALPAIRKLAEEAGLKSFSALPSGVQIKRYHGSKYTDQVKIHELLGNVRYARTPQKRLEAFNQLPESYKAEIKPYIDEMNAFYNESKHLEGPYDTYNKLKTQIWDELKPIRESKDALGDISSEAFAVFKDKETGMLNWEMFNKHAREKTPEFIRFKEAEKEYLDAIEKFNKIMAAKIQEKIPADIINKQEEYINLSREYNKKIEPFYDIQKKALDSNESITSAPRADRYTGFENVYDRVIPQYMEQMAKKTGENLDTARLKEIDSVNNNSSKYKMNINGELELRESTVDPLDYLKANYPYNNDPLRQREYREEGRTYFEPNFNPNLIRYNIKPDLRVTFPFWTK